MSVILFDKINVCRFLYGVFLFPAVVRLVFVLFVICGCIIRCGGFFSSIGGLGVFAVFIGLVIRAALIIPGVFVILVCRVIGAEHIKHDGAYSYDDRRDDNNNGGHQNAAADDE